MNDASTIGSIVGLVILAMFTGWAIGVLCGSSWAIDRLAREGKYERRKETR